jgi:hypothetical protein
VRRPGMVSPWYKILKAISRMSPPQFGHSSGNSSPALEMAAEFLLDVARHGPLRLVTSATLTIKRKTACPLPISCLLGRLAA